MIGYKIRYKIYNFCVLEYAMTKNFKVGRYVYSCFLLDNFIPKWAHDIIVITTVLKKKKFGLVVLILIFCLKSYSTQMPNLAVHDFFSFRFKDFQQLNYYASLLVHQPHKQLLVGKKRTKYNLCKELLSLIKCSILIFFTYYY